MGFDSFEANSGIWVLQELKTTYNNKKSWNKTVKQKKDGSRYACLKYTVQLYLFTISYKDGSYVLLKLFIESNVIWLDI